ncbi:MAG: nitrite/sulfite reductase [Aigarchaeota archaeon]|nr:nitrite/sulfite reductase [Aigarchaeota archaeon]MCX8192730.1 nitrite/sulfite reductase [Nitrososphaeria archaeon]MDW7985982.1 nitrite/sulfite reductase [Nitrososphaerota archaeon]
MCGQYYPKAGYGDVRNIVTCPLTGIHPHELIETSSITRKAVEMFTGKKEYLNLPRKFKIGISSCKINCIKPELNDLALVAIKSEYGIGFIPLVGGGLGPPPFLAQPLNIFVPLSEALEFIRTVVEVYRDHGPRDRKSNARFKWLIKEKGLSRVRELIEEKMGKSFQYLDCSKLNLEWREHDIVSHEKENGLYSLVVPTFTGLLNVHQFKKIIEIAERYGDEIRVSPAQKLVLIHVPEEELSRVKEELKMIGLDLGQPLIKIRTKACPSDFCGKSLESSKKRASMLLDYLVDKFGKDLEKLDIGISISGCPNSCAQHLISDIGLQSTLIKKDGISTPCFNLYIMGKGSKLSKLFIKNIPEDRVNLVIEDILKKFINSGLRDFHQFADKLLEGDLDYEYRGM